MLPVLLKLKLATAAVAAATSAPLPVPGADLAISLAVEAGAPVEVSLYDENLHGTADVPIARDGSTDPETARILKHLFRCRFTGREHAIAQKTLAMLADVADHYQGKTIEFVSAYRVRASESATSPHRDARAIDFRIRGVPLGPLRDYLWRTYSDVGIGWYPSEQFIHMDSRPGLHDTAWTFLSGENRYHPYWAALARRPVPVKAEHHAPHRPGV
ncbi:MAG TPA: DUF882 domain-containing protein [Kofleriaceae bacterium]|jgi:uncharacterized protein YcbK (DUF882 family)